MKKITALFMALILTLNLCACAASQLDAPDAETSQGPTWQEQYDLGVRYLSEGNYQEAIIAFTAAIEIDPKQAPAYVGRGNAYVLSGETEENLAAAKTDYETAIELDETNVEAYLGLADVYIQQGHYEKAMEILREAIEKTGENQRIVDAITEIETAHISEMVEAGDYSFLFTDDFMKPQDWIVNGKPIYECELSDFQVEFPHSNQAYPSVGIEGDGWTYVPSWPKISDDANVLVKKLNGSLGYTIYLWGQAKDRDFFFQPNLRGISTHDSSSEILQKIGFSTAGIQYLESASNDFDFNLPDDTFRIMLRHFDDILSDRVIYLTYWDRASSDVWYTTDIYFSFAGQDLYDIHCSYLRFYPGQ